MIKIDLLHSNIVVGKIAVYFGEGLNRACWDEWWIADAYNKIYHEMPRIEEMDDHHRG